MTTAVDLDRTLEVARRVAREAGELLRQGRQQGFAVAHKGEVDLVTEYDRHSEALVVEALSQAFPDHAVVGEEGTVVGAAAEAGRPVWYVDPLDGTTNYAHRLPWYAVSIGLEVDGEPLVGAIRAPEMDWDLWAARGRGAHLGSTRLRVSSIPDLDRALVATGFPYDRRTSPDNNVRELDAVLRRCQGVRRIGVASLDCALVAWGCLDAYWEHKLKPWDVSAGALLVLEAGGRVTLPDGSPYRSTVGHLVASNGLVHDELVAVLQAVAAGGR
jgi:myo-inositol-1(or 4)-monophosphatase